MSTLTVIELGSIFLIVLWNAFFVAAEYAFVTVRRTRLEELIEQGSRRAKAVMRIVDDLPSFISAIQLAITLSSLALGAVGEPAFSRVVEDILGLTGASREGLASTISVIIAFAVISTLHTVLGEIVPKTFTLAERRARGAVRRGSRSAVLQLLPPVHLVPRLARRRDRAHPRSAGAAAQLARPLGGGAEAPRRGVQGRGQDRGGGAGDGEQGLPVLRHRGGRGDGAASRRRRPARDAHAGGRDGGGAEAPVHALPGVPRGPRRHPRPAAHPAAVRRPAQRRPRPADHRVAAAAGVHRPRDEAAREAARARCGARTRTWRSWSTSTAATAGIVTSRTCWRRSSARSTTSTTGPTSRSCGCRRTACGWPGSFPIDEFNERFGCSPVGRGLQHRRRLRVRRAGPRAAAGRPGRDRRPALHGARRRRRAHRHGRRRDPPESRPRATRTARPASRMRTTQRTAPEPGRRAAAPSERATAPASFELRRAGRIGHVPVVDGIIGHRWG